MSTAGKVLTVLVMLVAVVWVLLTATVAQLNRNGTKAVQDLKEQVAKLESGVVTAARELDKLKEDTHTEQVKTQHDLTGLHARLSDAEKVLAQAREIAARVKLQLTDAESGVKQGEAHSAQRLAEKEAVTKEKADLEAEVEKLKAENGELLNRLTSLRDKFKATLRDNKEMVDRLMKSGGTRTARRASLPR
jgi:uncharacterized protein (DUF3084 family)